MEPSEDRYLTGHLTIHPEEETVYGLEKGKLVIASRNFIKIADPGFFEAPIATFAFEVIKITRETEAFLRHSCLISLGADA